MRVPVIQETPASCHRPKIVQPTESNLSNQSAKSSQESIKHDHKTSDQKVALPKDNLIGSVENVENIQSPSQLRNTLGDQTLAGTTSEHQVSSPTSSSSASLTTPVHSQQYARKTTPFRSVAPRVESSVATDSISSADPNHGSELPKISCLPPLLPSLLPVQLLPPSLVTAVQKVFSSLPGNTVTPSNAEPLCKALDLPVLLDSCLLHCVYGKQMKGDCVKMLSFLQQHSNLLLGKSRLFHLIKGCNGPNILKASDFTRLVRRLLSYHPQLEFFWCDSHSGMHAPYINSVVASMLWQAGGWRRGEINLRQFSTLNLEVILDMLQDPSQDLNLVPHFSYDQFYVAYVKFVHLDTSACGSLGPMELMDFEGGGQLGIALVERVFSRVLLNCPMQFNDWVFFLLAQVGAILILMFLFHQPCFFLDRLTQGASLHLTTGSLCLTQMTMVSYALESFNPSTKMLLICSPPVELVDFK